MVAGVTLLTAGAGLDWALSVKDNAAVLPPPGGGLVTETGIWPAGMPAVGTRIVIDVAETVEGEKLALPKLTLEVALKLLPFNVSETTSPTVALVGAMLVSTGWEFVGVSLMVCGSGGGGDWPPPGPGLLTPMLSPPLPPDPCALADTGCTARCSNCCSAAG